MNIKTYYYFQLLAEDLNMTRTAQKLGISQQALSSQIANLEAHYQIQLFERKPQLTLTYAGSRLLEYSQRLVEWDKHLSDELLDIRSGEKGQLRIGATAKRGFTIMPTLFPAFHKEYPFVEICMIEGSSAGLVSDLLEGRTDFCIIVTKIDDPRVHSEVISEERTLLFISDDLLRKYCSKEYDYLIQNKSQFFSIDIFRNCPFILNSSNNRVRKKCDALFASAGITPKIIFSSINALNLAEIAMQGVGATVLNSSTRADTVRGLHRFLIRGLSDPVYLKVSYLENHYLSRAARRFIALSKELLPQYTDLPQSIMYLE